MIGTEIRRRREEMGLTGAQLAARAGMAPSAVSQIETGKRSPSSSSVMKLAQALGVEAGELFPKGQAPTFSQPDFDGLLDEERRRAEREKRIEALPGWTRAALEDEEFVQRFEAAKSSPARARDLLTRQRKEADRIIAQLRDLKERNALPADLQAARRDLRQARAREQACTFMEVDLWRRKDVTDVRPVDILAEIAAARGDLFAALSGEADDFASEVG